MAAKRWAGVACIVFLVGLALSAYSNAFGASFYWDDVSNVRDHPAIRSLGGFFDRALFGAGGPPYPFPPNRVVGYVSFALNYKLGGVNPFGYHVANVAIHTLNALLVYALVLVAFATPRLRESRLAPLARAVALVAGVLFVAHPIQTQAVTYVVQRLASLATTFYVLAVVQFVRFRLAQEAGAGRATRGTRYATAVAAAVLATKTKEIAVTLPAAIVLAEVLLFGWPARRRILAVLPFVATALVIPVTWLVMARATAAGPGLLASMDAATTVQTTLPRLDYLRTELAVVATYLRLLVLPIGQVTEYDYPIYRSFLEPRVLGALCLHLGLLGLAVWLAIRCRARDAATRVDPAFLLVAFGIGWFFLALLVESSVIPIVDVIFEHRVYLPSVGMAVAAAVAIVAVLRWLAPSRAMRLAVGSAVVLAVGLGLATHRRNWVWADEVSLWRDTVEKSPGLRRPHMNLGLSLNRAGDVEGAIEQFRAALAVDPTYAEAHRTLGYALFQQGRVDEAIAELRLAVTLAPDDPEAHSNLGVAYSRKGWYEAAFKEMDLGARLRSSP